MRFTLTLATLFMGLLGCFAAEPNYEDDIQPILQKSCTECHSGRTAKKGIVLDSYESLKKSRGLLVPNKPDASRLLGCITSKKMPPKSYKDQPSDDDIELIRDWIKQGALKSAKQEAPKKEIPKKEQKKDKIKKEDAKKGATQPTAKTPTNDTAKSLPTAKAPSEAEERRKAWEAKVAAMIKDDPKEDEEIIAEAKKPLPPLEIRPLEKSVIEAYTKAGAKQGVFTNKSDSILLSDGLYTHTNYYSGIDLNQKPESVKGIPAFEFNELPKHPEDLPEINSPFGLSVEIKDRVPIELIKLCEKKNLVALEINGRKPRAVAAHDAVCIEAITKLKENKSLRIYIDNRITDAPVPIAVMKQLGRIPTLTQVSFRYTSTPGDGFSALTKLRRLQYLTMQSSYSPEIPEKTLLEIEKLSDLRFLEIAHKSKSPEVIKMIARLPALTTLRLNLSSDRVYRDAELEILKGSKSLKHLELEMSAYGDKGIDSVFIIPQLTYLILKGESVPRTSLEHLKSAKNLKTLSLTSTKVNDEAIPTLAGAEQLETLYLDSSKMLTGKSFDALAKMKHLKTVQLDFCENLTDEGIEKLSQSTSIENLELFGCSKLTDASLEHLKKMKSLKTCRVWWMSDREVPDEVKKAVPGCKFRVWNRQ